MYYNTLTRHIRHIKASTQTLKRHCKVIEMTSGLRKVSKQHKNIGPNTVYEDHNKSLRTVLIYTKTSEWEKCMKVTTILNIRQFLFFFLFIAVLLFLFTDPCYSNPCKNGGTCISDFIFVKCKCTDGFTGDRCTTGKQSLYCQKNAQ